MVFDPEEAFGKGSGRPRADVIGNWTRLIIALACGFVFFVLFMAGTQAPADGTHVTHPVPTLSEQRDSIIAQEARRAGAPVALSIAVSHVENWTGDSTAVSPRGAVGIMQVLPKF